MTQRDLTLSFQLHADLRLHPAWPRLFTLDVGPDGTVVGLLAGPRAKQPNDRPDRSPTAVGALIVKGVAMRLLEFGPHPLAYPTTAQPLAGSGLIVIGGPRDANAIVADDHGRIQRTFYAGDAIEHALVDEDGCLWVSFFDEGVYGGDHISTAGLVRFEAASGRLLWRANDESLEQLDWCALNVDREDGWVVHVGQLVRIDHDGGLTRWDVPDEDPHGHEFATDGQHLVAKEAFGASAVWAWRLGEASLVDRAQVRVTGLPPALWKTRWTGRGTKLYALGDGRVYVADLADAFA